MDDGDQSQAAMTRGTQVRRGERHRIGAEGQCWRGGRSLVCLCARLATVTGQRARTRFCRVRVGAEQVLASRRRRGVQQEDRLFHQANRLIRRYADGGNEHAIPFYDCLGRLP